MSSWLTLIVSSFDSSSRATRSSGSTSSTRRPTSCARATVIAPAAAAAHEGLGEDVTYANEDHDALDAAGPVLPLAGSWTLRVFSEHLAALDQFPAPPESEVYRNYRNWAFESAALDLALRQAGEPLHAVLGREPAPLRFVASLRLPDPPTLEPVAARLASTPTCASSSIRRRTGTSADRRARGARRSSRPPTSRASTPDRSSRTPPTPPSTVASSRASRTPGSRTRR